MKLLFPALLLLIFTGCTSPAPQPLQPAFFYWETNFSLSPDECSIMDSLGCKKLYIKTLDIGKNTSTGEIEPYSRIEVSDTTGLSGRDIIPCVFITNEVFQNIPEANIAWLAEKIANAAAFDGRMEGLLIDCDWTASSRDKFFHFLKTLKGLLPKQVLLSATIRLHQYKFPNQTGVPPVDRGMLMFYNTGDVETEGENNSIFHPDEALKYLQGAPHNYPLPLDLALPLFSWGLVYREGEFWKIIPGPLPFDEMRHNGKYLEQSDAGPFSARLWEVREGTFLGGHYLRPGDHLRVSQISPELLFKAAGLAQKLDLAEDASLVYFHVGIATQEHFSAQLLDRVCKTVRK